MSWTICTVHNSRIFLLLLYGITNCEPRLLFVGEFLSYSMQMIPQLSPSMGNQYNKARWELVIPSLMTSNVIHQLLNIITPLFHPNRVRNREVVGSGLGRMLPQGMVEWVSTDKWNTQIDELIHADATVFDKTFVKEITELYIIINPTLYSPLRTNNIVLLLFHPMLFSDKTSFLK